MNIDRQRLRNRLARLALLTGSSVAIMAIYVGIMVCVWLFVNL